ncbi:Aldo/Keto reductase [Tribonema minus]|uniref:Aldo/Keto reductase n=1 Tax=Tribonema minus TaxID=303371 RepID=A0A836CIZ5_9STRA|nr:Aldo/Keto reductase [Tribonema minus]
MRASKLCFLLLSVLAVAVLGAELVCEGDQCEPPPHVPATFTLNDGNTMPRVGYGTAGLGESVTMNVLTALKAGFRHIDSAQAYEWYNERGVGAALLKASEEGEVIFIRTPRKCIPRDSIFVTSKLHPRDFGARTRKQFHESLHDLQTDYVDLFLLHYAECWSGLHCPGEPGTWQEAWAALGALQAEGKIRSLGVSNFNPDDLRALIAAAQRGDAPMPAVVQNWFDPLHRDAEIRAICAAHNITYVSYSTLGTQHPGRGGNPVLTNPVIKAIAARQGTSPARVVLSWALQSGVGVLPRAGRAAHVEDNAQLLTGGGGDALAVFLSAADMAAIDALAT